jgi:hypothetical protein
MTGEIRASDADRLRIIQALEQHTAAGRLTLDEFAQRAGDAFAARTLGDLAAVTRDLPDDRLPAAHPATPPGTDARHLAWAFAIAAITLVFLGLLMMLR